MSKETRSQGVRERRGQDHGTESSTVQLTLHCSQLDAKGNNKTEVAAGSSVGSVLSTLMKKKKDFVFGQYSTHTLGPKQLRQFLYPVNNLNFQGTLTIV